MEKHGKLSFRIAGGFALFAVVTMAVAGLLTYFSQMNIYTRQNENNIKDVARYIESLIQADGIDFIHYTDYYKEHFKDVDIPIDVEEYESYEREYYRLMAEHHPGRVLDVNITFDELDDEVKQAYFIYSHVYWLLTFEWAREDFNLPYTYFLVPDTDTRTVMYMVDGERSSRAGHLQFIEENPQYREYDQPQGDEAEYMYLGDTYLNEDDEQHAVIWDTWITGKEQNGFVVWHNIWGDTYSYYVPVWMEGRELGLVVAEVNIADVNKEILHNTLRLVLVLFGVFAVALIGILIYINSRFIRRIVDLENGVMEYTSHKNAEAIRQLDKDRQDDDEIGSLTGEIASMVTEIENHIRFLMMTSRELAEAKGDVQRMSDLAQKDALTGIRNRTAYEKEIEKTERELAVGRDEFGIAMIDLNFLKRLNDTYGHEQGNEAIKKLCFIVCHVFEHSPVFRIGGDEFVVVLKGDDFRNRDALLLEFNGQLARLQTEADLQPWERVSAAVGIAAYDKTVDSSANDVVKRADTMMYERKKAMKALRTS
ncbi:MAG: diguanylate cyclase [Lachnospiraceae bacterium]|nr:diguanylate cyclase [Lachnospiraceae bacterium]